MSYIRCGVFSIKPFAELRIVHTFAARKRGRKEGIESGKKGEQK
jgi:hypothetical protein